MNREEFIEFVSKNDERRGNFEATLQRKEHRYERIRTIDEKILKLADFLRKKCIPFMVMEMVFKVDCKNPMFADLYIPKYRIAIRNVKDSDYSRKLANDFFCKSKYLFYPVYVRHDESMEFIVEKLDHTIQKAIESPKTGRLKHTIVGARPKRERIRNVKVSR